MPPDDVEWPPSDLFGNDITWTPVAGVDEMWTSEPRSDRDEISRRHMWWVHNRPDGHHCGIAMIGFPPHQLVAEKPLHIEASLLCSCRLHGWIREGSWVSA